MDAGHNDRPRPEPGINHLDIARGVKLDLCVYALGVHRCGAGRKQNHKRDQREHPDS